MESDKDSEFSDVHSDIGDEGQNDFDTLQELMIQLQQKQDKTKEYMRLRTAKSRLPLYLAPPGVAQTARGVAERTSEEDEAIDSEFEEEFDAWDSGGLQSKMQMRNRCVNTC